MLAARAGGWGGTRGSSGDSGPVPGSLITAELGQERLLHRQTDGAGPRSAGHIGTRQARPGAPRVPHARSPPSAQRSAWGGVLAGSHRGRRPACVRALGRGLWLHPLSALTTHSQGSGQASARPAIGPQQDPRVHCGRRSTALRPVGGLWSGRRAAAPVSQLCSLLPPQALGLLPDAPPRASCLAPFPASPLSLSASGGGASAYSSVRTPGAAVHLGRRRLPEGAFALAGHPQVFAAVRGFLCGAEDEGGR